MVMSSVLLLSCASPLADAHGGLVRPPTWMNAGGNTLQMGGWQWSPGCAGTAEAGGPTGRTFRSLDANNWRCNAMWFTNWTRVPEGVQQDIVGHWSEFKTYAGDWTWKQRMPWSAPGKAPVNSPCGTDGGNPRGCWTGSGFPGNGNTEVQCGSGGYGQGEDARTFNFPQVPVTQWAAGSVQEVAWGITANHGGGYAYRLCKLDSGGKPALTENCFQNGHLKFTEDISYFQRFRRTRGTSKAKTFQGETGPWRRNPVPACRYFPGETGCETQFEPPSCDQNLYGFGSLGHGEPGKYIIKDKVKIPEEITAGDYVLSWRYDAEQTPQVWFGCADIRITSSYTGPQTFAVPGPAPTPPPAPLGVAPESEPEGEHEAEAEGEGAAEGAEPEAEGEPEGEHELEASICAAGENQECVCGGTVYYGRKFVSGKPGSGVVTTLSELRKMAHKTKVVSGSISCSSAAMGGDPQGGYYKHCFCEPQPALVQKLSTKLSRQVTMSVDDHGSVEQM